MSLLTENETLKEASQVRQLPQLKATLIILHINQETSTSASVIEKINTFNTLKSEWLPEYYEKNLREHSNFFCSTDILFNINTLYFSTERLKIYFTMQYFRKESWDMWYNKLEELSGPESIKKIIFKNFKQFLLDLVKNFMNCQLHHAQLHQNIKQKPQQSIQVFILYLKNLKAHISSMTEKHYHSILFMKLQPKLRVAFTNFQILPDTFESLIALGVRLEQNQWQLSSSTTLTKHSQSENDVREGTNAGQQSKKPKGEKISVPNQHKKWTDDKNKKGVICYQCNKKGHYKSQCPKLAREQLKNANQAPVKEVCVKGKDQHPQKSLQMQSKRQ